MRSLRHRRDDGGVVSRFLRSAGFLVIDFFDAIGLNDLKRSRSIDSVQSDRIGVGTIFGAGGDFLGPAAPVLLASEFITNRRLLYGEFCTFEILRFFTENPNGEFLMAFLDVGCAGAFRLPVIFAAAILPNFLTESHFRSGVD
ncbi:hypothetical protein F2Q70_00004013 [Brassica cretica]|uniref:Uncharacterized protein n=1 Tax=Brassica cretica TaxID=69181 RepID=A0A8S9IRG6_BRACR|nr:hypothetical protein F2Q70_00004013 [Brassica cretica]